MRQLFLLIIFFSSTTALAKALCPLTGDLTVSSRKMYSEGDQIKAICYLEKNISKYYAKNILVDFERQSQETFNDCFAEVKDKDIYPMQFNGLIRKCIKRFENGHLAARLLDASAIFLPFSLVKSSKRFYVSNVLENENCALHTNLQVGDEILRIGSENIDKLVEELNEFQYASSDVARTAKSVISATHRKFSIPSEGAVDIVVLREGQTLSFTENYFFHESKENFEAEKSYLIEKGFRHCPLKEESQVVKEGYSAKDPIYAPDWIMYSDKEHGSPLAYFSRFENHAGKKSCYFRLNSFSYYQGYTDGSQGLQNLYEKLYGELFQCKADNSDLVLDLRRNLGGSWGILSILMSQLLPNGHDFFSRLRRATLSHSLVDPRVECTGEEPADQFPSIDVAKVYKGSFCEIMNPESYWEEGYGLPITVLTSPLCMSSCEFATMALKELDNVTLLGSPTHGGQNGVIWNSALSADKELFANADTIYFYFDDTMTYLSDQEGLLCASDGTRCLTPLEGQSVAPHRHYEVTKEDLTSSPLGAGWKKQIQAVFTERRKPHQSQ